MRTCTVRSLAKLNLDLRVLYKRPDGFHELRTVFQTISLHDTLTIEYRRSPSVKIAIDGNVDIADNLIARAAVAVCEAAGRSGSFRFQLEKRIPMGAGLGGGSSNAAAVLLALPALIGAQTGMDELREIGSKLGSDVPFFLFGGCALGLGRGTELYPLPDVRSRLGVLAASEIHSSTADAYRGLNRQLTTSGYETDTSKFQSVVWGLGEDRPGDSAVNDFEPTVFGRFPRLRTIRDNLRQAGARPAMMTGSGSALFGLFDSAPGVSSAIGSLRLQSNPGERLFRFSLTGRRRYQRLWRGWLQEHIIGDTWPPRSRY